MLKLFTEDFKTEPYWWDQPAPVPEAALPAKADVVVIGSGYTGLHAALQTCRGGRGTVVLDAEAAGWGCSTRNGGQIGTSIKPAFDDLARKHGRERALRIHREGHNALAWIERFVAEENIACDFSICGRFHAAHNPIEFEKLGKAVQQKIPGLEVDVHLVPRSEQRSELGTDAYHGGVIYPRHASLHPARYHHGLLQRTQDSGASIHAHCPAINIERNGRLFKVATARGSISARDVVIASNGYTGTLTPWQRRRVIPIGSYIIATEALPAELMHKLIPNNRVVSDTRRVVYYYRASPDRSRILFGGRVSHNETDTRSSAILLHRDMVDVFPELAETRISHSWMGLVAYTFDTLAHVGRHDGIYYALGYCGSGVSMASYLGMRIGQQVLGDSEGETGFDGLAFPTRPLYYGNPWFLGCTVRYHKWRDKQNR